MNLKVLKFCSLTSLFLVLIRSTGAQESETERPSYRHDSVEVTTGGNATTNLTSPCLLDVEPGPCYGKFLKFYYSASDKKCKAFFYGGCYGNGNQFQTVEECNFVCVDNDWPPYPIDGGGGSGENETENEPETEPEVSSRKPRCLSASYPSCLNLTL